MWFSIYGHKKDGEEENTRYVNLDFVDFRIDWSNDINLRINENIN